MKKICIVLVAHACSILMYSQASIKIDAGAHIKSAGGAYMVLDNINVANNGSFQQAAGSGFVKLTGAANVSLSGNGSTSIDVLLLQKDDGAIFNLNSNLSIVSNVNFSGGLLNLNNSVVDLSTTGSFIDESDESRAFTIGTGYVQANGIINNPPSPVNLGNLGAMISSTANMGLTVIRRGHAIQMGVTGSNNSIRRFFDIIPTQNQNIKATLRFFYFDAELNDIPEPSLHQYKSKDNINWDFVGANSRNITINYVEKTSINKFERFTLATATPPSISCPQNITSNANLNGCKASVAFAATATGVPAPTITYRIGNSVITSPHVFPKGTTTVSATASNALGPNATCSFTVTVVCAPASSITKTAEPQRELKISPNDLDLIAYPNPSTGNFSVTVQADLKQKITMQVVDMSGRVIEVRNVMANSTTRFGDGYRPGTYFVRIMQGRDHKEIKLIKLSD